MNRRRYGADGSGNAGNASLPHRPSMPFRVRPNGVLPHTLVTPLSDIATNT